MVSKKKYNFLQIEPIYTKFVEKSNEINDCKQYQLRATEGLQLLTRKKIPF